MFKTPAFALRLMAEKPSLPVPRQVWQDPLYFFVFGFGIGAIPLAPGTFGTLLAIPFYLLMRPLPLIYYIAIVVLFCVLSMWACAIVSRKIVVHDHPGMCVDEFAGFFVTMINAPHGWQWILLGFVLFRFFDILKPNPIRFLDKNIHGGFGMVLDDIAAGIASMIILQVLAAFLT